MFWTMHCMGHSIYSWSLSLNSKPQLQGQKQLDVDRIRTFFYTKRTHCRSYNIKKKNPTNFLISKLNNSFITQKLRVPGSLYPVEWVLRVSLRLVTNFKCMLFTWKGNTQSRTDLWHVTSEGSIHQNSWKKDVFSEFQRPPKFLFYD